jgi:hypothetical protein
LQAAKADEAVTIRFDANGKPVVSLGAPAVAAPAPVDEVRQGLPHVAGMSHGHCIACLVACFYIATFCPLCAKLLDAMHAYEKFSIKQQTYNQLTSPRSGPQPMFSNATLLPPPLPPFAEG